MQRFILLLRSEEIDFSSYSPEDYQRLLSDFDEWNIMLEKKGLLASAGLNGNDAQTVRRKEGETVTDGPYCETKEAITGICLINADDHEHAVKLASACPFISRGGSVEVRGINQLEIEQLVKVDDHEST